ncbi:MAG TPA: GHKL domain-containing protein, partial [Gammaproteobacteria bacterium]|nr:GHKL domain-containing protein [Gammaproteobacteria bacterium]
LEAFSYSVSHDLRSPLRAIDGFSKALLEDYQDRLDDTALDYLQRVCRGAERMGHLIDDLLQLSRVSRTALEKRSVDLRQLAEEITGKLREREPERQVQIVLGESLTTRGDERLLSIVLENLFENAWKFTRYVAAPHIEFGMVKEGDETVFFVRDNGAGFDMTYADKLFGAFQRLHSAQDFEGTGIGLATVQRIVHRHGGRVWAEAVPGEGATFYFTLSAAD